MTRLLRRSRILTAVICAVAIPVTGFALASPASAAVSNGPIVFVSGRSGNADVWRMNADGSDPQQLTSDVSDEADPAPSPNGSEIAFISNRDGNGEIYLMGADGAGQSRLTTTPEDESQPSWSPDGTRLVFLRGNSSDIWTIGADGTNERQVTAEIDIDNSPVFSPDGLKIAFSRSAKIWTTDLDGENQTPISTGANDLEPAYLPDGRILYRATNEVYVMGGDGSNPTDLSQDPVFAGQPAPSPDGQRVAFLSLRNTVVDLEFDIYVMDVDGSNQTNLTAGFTNDYLPAWSAVPPTGSDPSTSFTGQPASVSNDGTPTFAFEADEPSTFECSLVAAGQPDAFSSCTSPVTPSSLADGAYVFKVRATDVDLNVESPPRSVTFTIDTVVPSATIDGSAATADNTPSIGFAFDETVSTVCKIAPVAGSATFELCTSPFTPPAPLADGSYVFTVRGTDPASNAGTETFGFSVDTTAPVASITGPTVTSDNTPSFTFSFDEATVAKGCSVHAPGAGASFGSCDSPFVPATLADGDYVLEVRGTDATGNTAAAAVHAFTIDSSAPSVSLTPPVLTNDRTPSFMFSSDGAVLTCSLSPGSASSFVACSSPYTAASSLVDGDYVFTVRATDAAGNTGEASGAFTVDGTPPVITVTALSKKTDRTPTFSFASSDVVGGFTCAVDAGVFATCVSAFTTAKLKPRSHTLWVRGSDAAGTETTKSFPFKIRRP